MWEEQSMGSQTLEILRQGVWASATGGWFYDPSQDVFCNTFHLYTWLFLLCLPFSIYLYFPPAEYIWYFYCVAVTIAFSLIKTVNYYLHRIYDTKECIQEEVSENSSNNEQKREDEGIEMQDLSNRETDESVRWLSTRLNILVSLAEAGARPGVDLENFDLDYQQLGAAAVENVNRKQSSTIDLKAEVHRNNSSESSDAGAQIVEVITHEPPAKDNPRSAPEKRARRSKTEGCVTVTVKDEKNSNKHYKKHSSPGRSEDHKKDTLQSVDSEQIAESSERKRLNFTNSSLNFLPVQQAIKPTGSLELGYIDKNPNQSLTSEGFYFKHSTRMGVRRIRSTALETCCPPPSLTAHPNSLEVIGCKGARNPLPPPSTSLTRNQHLNLCPYYGSEIVYPIAEQSDEHQTSHGPDTDLDSMTHMSDSDFEENNQGSNSPLLYIKLKKLQNVPYSEQHGKPSRPPDEERTSATSKDALLDRDNPNSSNAPEVSGAAQADCYATDNDVSSDKSANLSCSSVECDRTDYKSKARTKWTDDKGDFRGCSGRCRGDREGASGAVKKRNVRKNRRKRGEKVKDNSSSLVELDLDWLFDDEGHKLQHRKEPLKKDSEWSSTTTVSLEHDVSKVLLEPLPAMRSLGAIPKRPSTSASKSNRETNTPKSESKKCRSCRCKPHNKEYRNRPKENKITQTLRPSDSLENLSMVFSPSKPPKVNLQKRDSIKSTSGKNEEASSSGSNNELSTLLPPVAPLLSAFLNSRRELPPSNCNPNDCFHHSPHPQHHRSKLRRERVSRRRPAHLAKKENAIACSLSAGYGTHSAKHFNDTTDGAVHCFMDEHGNWVTYTFDEKGVGTSNIGNAENATNDKPAIRRKQSDGSTSRNKSIMDLVELWDSPESMCSSTVSTVQESNKPAAYYNESYPYTRPVRLRHNFTSRPVATQNIKLMLEDVLNSNEPTAEPDFMKVDESVAKNRFKLIRVNNSEARQTRSYYKIKLFPWAHIKVTIDRLKLLTLLDRNLTICETVLSILLAILVGVLGATLLYLDFYKDLLAFVFCFIIASCQYSLLKSVQPDAASPTHGFNRVIAYSRPVYFCLFCALILILHANIDADSKRFALIFAREFFIKFILFLPVLFSLGLFPQINTFTLYLLEQVDIHIFGGNAMSSLTGSFYCIFRSILAVVVLVGLAYGALIEEKSSQHILFSIFCACLIGTCYHLSRSASDPTYIWNLVKKHLWLPDIYKDNDVEAEEPIRNEKKSVKFPPDVRDNAHEEHVDPLPHKMQKTVNARLKNDVILCCLSAILVFAIHASTVFTVLHPELSPVLWSMAATLGVVLHYVVPQLRKQLPWLCIARPIFRSHEHEHFQIRGPAKIMWFERVTVYFCFVERNVLFPLLFLSVLTEDAPKIALKYGAIWGAFITVVCGLKCLRSTYSDQSFHYLVVVFTTLFFKYDYSYLEETFLVEYFLMSIVFQKLHELILKLQFVITYIAPWQITWGSAFHAFAQPFSVPHSAMLFMQALVSSVLSTPLNPFLGSAIFFTSYVRPVKFWERDYNTRRVDHSNTPLSSHLDRNLGADDNNLNSIFYEHLTRSLQHSLCGDLAMGRWGPVSQGDVFVMASDYLNCLVHIIELGNGLVTFQMRGLEFRGTYCQQREVEAITEGVEENDGCCCCDTGHLPNMLSINAAFSQRWLAWEVTASKYILEGYSISDNSVVSMLQVFEFRKVLVSYYVKSIIFYTVRSSKLNEWLTSQVILKALQPIESLGFVDLDTVFNYNIDEDYDVQQGGMTKYMFMQVHGDWINFCVEKNEKPIENSKKQTLYILCFALSLLGRRTLGAVSHNTVSSVEFFLYGLHALFKGDFRITCPRDEWVFTDMDLLKTVVAPGVRMSLKLHQDHFMSPDEYEELSALYEAICKHEAELVISHEGDPAWRNAVLSGTPSLLALRHVFDEGTDEYKIIMLNKRHLSFRIIKINRECVRGLWAGQQQELVYLRNRNPERGSIQNAKQALRNIINSSCDQPIGYPIYVSPLTTSYAETNEQYRSVIGGSISLKKIRGYLLDAFRRVRKRCGEGCSSGGSNREEIGMGHEGVYAMTPMTFPMTGSQSIDGSHLGGSMGRGSSLSRTSLGGNRGSLVSVGKPTGSTLASLAGLFKERDERAVSQAPDAHDARQDERLGDADDAGKEFVASRVRITDASMVYDSINLGRRIDVLWPTDYMRCRGGKSYWKEWVPDVGMEGLVVHKWSPCHKDPTKRSHIDKTILLVQIEDKFVPILEFGIQDLGPEV